MAYDTISIYRGFGNQSKKTDGNLSRGVGGVIQPIGGLGILKVGRGGDGYSRF